MGQEITIQVKGKNSWTTDYVTIKNMTFAYAPAPPANIISDPSGYNYPVFDPSLALNGQGRWVVVGGVRYFVPYTQQPNWVPYQHGYWSWTQDGWTWISYDPWGWMTDHYGLWRHHGVYGWIWLPFADFTYRPAVVTFFYGEGHVGWYPYYDGYSQGYRHGYAEGFNDGYWDGYRAGSHYGHGSSYYPGMTVVTETTFVSVNIFGVRITESVSYNIWGSSYSRSQYGEHFGGRDRQGSRSYIEDRCRSQIPETRTRPHRMGDRDFVAPVAFRDVPESYRNPEHGPGRFERPAPVGSVIGSGHGPGHVGAITPPTSNGRGIAQPPRAIDPRDGISRPLPPRTSTPALPQPSHPIYHRPELPANPGHGAPAPALPGYNPHQPVPRPTFQPRPLPEPMPAPRPTFNPPQPAPRPTFNPPQPAPRPTFNQIGRAHV